MDQSHADRNLLVGILALQMDFVARDELIAAMNAWVLDKDVPLSDLLYKQGTLTAPRRMLLDALVDEHIRAHGGDPHKSLAALSSVTSIRQDIAQIDDTDLQASIDALGIAPARPPSADATFVGEATSDGLRFRILRPHAKGGLGQVSVALDQELDRKVALKEIQLRHADDPRSRARFVQEAEITGKLEHPGIIPVYGLGHDPNGRPFYAMRFIEGDSLKDAIRRFHADETTKRNTGQRSLRLRALLRRFQDVCNALAYAHSRGVLHRDLKPGNIMLGPFGETLVVDWGLAKPTGKELASDPDASTLVGDGPVRASKKSGSREETLPGRAIGTPGYMSPEQAAGRLDLLSPASDVYGLGAILYNLLTGKAPIEGEGLDLGEVLRRVQLGEFPPPRSIDATIPKSLESICLKAMSVRIEDRYPSAKALAGDVERWLADEAILAQKESTLARAARWARRHKPTVAAAVALLATSIVALAVSNLLLQREQFETARQRNLAETTATTLRRQLYVQNLNLAQREWQANNVGLTESLLEQCPSELRGWEWSYLKNLCHLDLLTLRGHSTAPGAIRWSLAGVYGLDFSPDGKQIASAGSDNLVKIWEVSTGREIRSLKGHNDVVFAVSFSPDGGKIATGSKDTTIKLWDAKTGDLVRTLEGHASWVRALAFSPDGSQVVSGSGAYPEAKIQTPELILWDVATGKMARTFTGHSAFIQDVAFRPDGKEIASAGYDGTARLWNPTTDNPVHVLFHEKHLCSVAYSPDGKQIVVSGQDSLVSVWDAESGRPIRSFQGHAGWAYDAVFRPDGKQIAVAGYDQTARLLDLAKGVEVATIRGHTGPVNAVRFSPNGQELATASGDNTVKIWSVASGSGEADTLMRLDGIWATLAAYSRDGRRIFSVHGDCKVRLWDVATESLLRSLDTSCGSGTYTAGFSPDGRTVAMDFDTAIKLFDGTNGQGFRTLIGHEGKVTGLYFSPDGNRLASIGADGTIRLWDVASGQKVRTIAVHGHSAFHLGFHPDGHTIASIGWDSTVRLWDVATGQLLRTHGDVPQVRSDRCGNGLEFSPDGLHLAAASDDMTVKVWDVATGEKVLTLRGHTKEVNAVAYLDQTRIVSASEDATIKIWDSITGENVLTLRGHSEGVLSVACRSDGKQIASGSVDYSVKIWDGSPQTPERIKRKREQGLSSYFDRIANELVDRGFLLDEFKGQIHTNRVLDEDDRRRFLIHAEKLWAGGFFRDVMINLSWPVVANRAATPDQLKRALRQAEYATSKNPDNSVYLNILGVAQYRNGRYEDALKTLGRSLPLNEKLFHGPIPGDLAFLAMTQLRLVKITEARASFAKLAEAMKTPRWKDHAKFRQFLAEAEELFRELKVPTTGERLLDEGFPDNPFAP
jgi:WD40 repeat protein/serine/threonine protein kinase